jgi:nucleotide-binding universal stress UspA family protein
MSGIVVVGVDGSPGSDRALLEAAADARRRDATLRIVHVWSYLDQAGGKFDPSFGREAAQAVLAASVRTAGDGLAGLSVETVEVCDLAVRGLLDAARDADVVVVGARGIGGFRGLLLGSVSQQVAQHAECPVLIVPTPSEGPHED